MVEECFDQKAVVVGDRRSHGPGRKTGEMLVAGLEGGEGPGPGEGVNKSGKLVRLAALNDKAEQVKCMRPVVIGNSRGIGWRALRVRNDQRRDNGTPGGLGGGS